MDLPKCYSFDFTALRKIVKPILTVPVIPYDGSLNAMGLNELKRRARFVDAHTIGSETIRAKPLS